MSESLIFRLVGQDGLSRVLLRAGMAARRLDDDLSHVGNHGGTPWGGSHETPTAACTT